MRGFKHLFDASSNCLVQILQVILLGLAGVLLIEEVLIAELSQAQLFEKIPIRGCETTDAILGI